MKIWYGYGSEHSMNLVMIGRFEDAGDAAKAKQIIERLTEQVEYDVQAGHMEIGEHAGQYTDDMLNLLLDLNIATLGPAEVEQFAYEVSIDVENSQVVLTTEESDVSAFFKVLIENGARVEVYSAHHHSGTGYGRGG